MKSTVLGNIILILLVSLFQCRPFANLKLPAVPVRDAATTEPATPSPTGPAAQPPAPSPEPQAPPALTSPPAPPPAPPVDTHCVDNENAYHQWNLASIDAHYQGIFDWLEYQM